MSTKRRVSKLFVCMNGLLVGTLIRKPSGALSFSYDPGWQQRKEARPISLSMPVSNIIYNDARVYNFFDNLLPDNQSIRERIQTRFAANTNTCFDLLSYIGVDCVGALQLLTHPEPLDIKEIQANPLDEHSIATLLKSYQTAPLGMDRNSEFRISIAGAQEKTALLWYQNQWYLPKNVTPTTHIIKLPIGYIKHAGIDLSESVENEWLCLKIIEAFGLPVNEAKIVQFEDVKTLVVKRFDRRWVKNEDWLVRLPQEDMCQALKVPPALKYESDGGPGIISIMQLLQGAFDPIHDRYRFMKTVFLFWVLGAIDGHAKNFSIAIEAAGQYRLTPIYDVISAYPIVAKGQLQTQKLKMAMSLKGKNRHYHWDDIQIRHWMSTADLCRFPEESIRKIIEDVCDNMEKVISRIEEILPKEFPLYMAKAVFDGMRQVKNRCQQKMT